jgi:acetyl-CoA C-acetyltransferase
MSMGLRGEAAIVGLVELSPERKPTRKPATSLEQWTTLAKAALDDAGIAAEEVDGIVTASIRESDSFVPSTIVEYLGLPVNFAEHVDLGGATPAGMIWRAAAAIELGLASVVLCVAPAGPLPAVENISRPRNIYGASSNLYGSPQSEFEIPFGYLGQNVPYATIAQRYGAEFGYDPRALAKIAADQRTSACAYPPAVFHGLPITIDDVLNSPMIADPIHLLEIVMPCFGGAAVVVVSDAVARRLARHRPVRVKGFGERVAWKMPAYATDLMHSPIKQAAEQAFAMAAVGRDDIDMISVYDCYTITVLMTIENAGFCELGQGADFINSHDLTFRGDFPCNTHGGQLSFGQPGLAGGMSHVCDAVRQVMGRSGENQVADCNNAFVSGNGGIMSEQVALILQGD